MKVECSLSTRQCRMRSDMDCEHLKNLADCPKGWLSHARHVGTETLLQGKLINWFWTMIKPDRKASEDSGCEYKLHNQLTTLPMHPGSISKADQSAAEIPPAVFTALNDQVNTEWYPAANQRTFSPEPTAQFGLQLKQLTHAGGSPPPRLMSLELMFFDETRRKILQAIVVMFCTIPTESVTESNGRLFISAIHTRPWGRSVAWPCVR